MRRSSGLSIEAPKITTLRSSSTPSTPPTGQSPLVI
jgi:hypothetical protein